LNGVLPHQAPDDMLGLLNLAGAALSGLVIARMSA
jgi:hypothetical protein